MSRPTHLGTRYACWQCGTKFYDLNKPNPACPKCGADPREAPKAAAPAVSEPKPPRKVRPAALADEETETLEDEEDFEEGDDLEDEGVGFEDEEEDF